MTVPPRISAEFRCFGYLLLFGVLRGLCEYREWDRKGLKLIAACDSRNNIKKVFWKREAD